MGREGCQTSPPCPKLLAASCEAPIWRRSPAQTRRYSSAGQQGRAAMLPEEEWQPRARKRGPRPRSPLSSSG
eukprot:241224-Alexandrium_andersonii.AAC.1